MNVDSAFPSKYLKASDLGGRRSLVTIREYTMEAVGSENEDDKPVLYFEGKNKGLVLNKTNAISISDILSQPEMDAWCGRKIVLYPTKTDYQGKRVPCIRIDEPDKGDQPAPVQAPVPREPGDEDDSAPF